MYLQSSSAVAGAAVLVDLAQVVIQVAVAVELEQLLMALHQLLRIALLVQVEQVELLEPQRPMVLAVAQVLLVF
jgi:hypothetical protein